MVFVQGQYGVHRAKGTILPRSGDRIVILVRKHINSKSLLVAYANVRVCDFLSE